MSGERDSSIFFGTLADVGRRIDCARTVIVTDPMVRRLHGADFPPCRMIEVERGEAAKTLASAEKLYDSFLALGVDRAWTALAIGGGSISDLAGFAASTWLRGIDFGFSPTTLLAMLDASIGGKNGVDFRGRKNLVGTFTKPRFVNFDVSLLGTLPDEDFASGMAEAIKHGIIEGEPHFRFLEERCASRPAMGLATLEELVRRSVDFKTEVAGRDERESGERRKLNLGHTIGHAIEAVTGLSHGRAVAAGLGAALRFSVARHGGDPAMEARVAAFLAGWGLPASIRAAADLAGQADGLTDVMADGSAFRKAVAGALAADKKRISSDILFALPVRIGEVRIVPISLTALCDFVMEAP